MPSVFLSSPWKLNDFAPGEGLDAGAFQVSFDDNAWLPVDVPGGVHPALIAAGRIEDPFYDRNEEQCAWIEDREWWYRLTFDGPAEPLAAGERWRLIFHGLDTFVTIWLNGEKLGQHQNMFREAAFDVSDRLLPNQPNTLALCFDRPLAHTEGFEQFKTEWQWKHEPRVFMRKAQFSYGWDWGPRLPEVGIWRPVELRRESRAAIAGVHFYTLEIDRDQNRAVVAVRVEADRFAAQGALAASVRLDRAGASPVTATIPLHGEGERVSGTAYLTVEDAALWWTHDLGEPALYALQVTLAQDGVELDQHAQQVGIRTIELDQSPDPAEPGTRFFRFVLNGVPLFAKGADWIPADSFVGTIPSERYESLLSTACDAHMNMLRVWGGGIYEHDVFYDLCDRMGLLIWQDFMFACALYPEDEPEFVSEVEAEARYQVARLRSHPCMAVWCGNNENQWIFDQVFWQKHLAYIPGSLYYDEILPRACAELDGQIPYWPGSPYGGNDHNSMTDGDRHNWDVWHGASPRKFGEEPKVDYSAEGVSYRRYANDTARFVSEFGMHAAPVFETLRRNIPADQLYHHSPSMDHHNKDNPKNKGDRLMEGVTGVPKDLDEYIDFSMIAQAEGLKFGIEHFRRRKPHCSGTLFWQLNDCWPVLSWSVVDYYGFGKAGYFYAKRVYAPVLASFKALDDGSVELWITNDRLAALDDTVTIRLRAFDGQTFWQREEAVSLEPNSSACVVRLAAENLAAGPDRYLSVQSASGLFPANRHFFVPIMDLQRDALPVSVTVEAVDEHTLNVHISADKYAYFVNLSVPHEGTAFSDNYFDLEPGEQRTITVTNANVPLRPDMLTVKSR
ncbi:beta-mannosidase [Aggregatilinea lenta]|uniref:beta-mannosidase n=1 Tax=Aggregatilinea lenta TaxID=913108 RepID=UPI000E5C09E2|nr:glycoside hydrolase family 2 protein [Aggregatilinea lenta]